MSVKRVQDRYSNDAETAKKSIEYWMSTLGDNIDLVPPNKLEFVLRCEKVLEAARPLLEWEVNELEHVYELVCAAALGTERIKKHVDRRRKGLRYGK